VRSHVSGHHIHKRRTHECAYVPSKFCTFREGDRESELGRNEITNLSYSAHTYTHTHTHTHTHTEYDTTPKLSVYPPIGCWWLVVLVTPIVPKTSPSLSKTKHGLGQAVWENNGNTTTVGGYVHATSPGYILCIMQSAATSALRRALQT